MIKIGDRFPEATLSETTEFGEACPMRPHDVKTSEALAKKKVVVFGLPGAYTPTCSAKHVPGYLEHLAQFKAHHVDEIWCVSVNDGFVMAAWGRDQHAIGKIRFLGDGGGELAKALGLDVTIPGMGLRMNRFSLFVDDGVVKQVNVEAPGKFEVSDANTMLKQVG